MSSLPSHVNQMAKEGKTQDSPFYFFLVRMAAALTYSTSENPIYTLIPFSFSCLNTAQKTSLFEINFSFLQQLHRENCVLEFSTGIGLTYILQSKRTMFQF